MSNPFNMLWKHRKMLWATTLADIRSRYAGSALGMFWLILYPILMLSAYSIVYVFILRIRLDQISAALVKNTLYPIEIIPVKAIFFSQCTEVVGLALLVIVLAVSGLLTPWALLVIPLWAFQVMFGIGIGWIVSAFNVILRDLQSLVSIITMFLMMVSPIAYTPDMIPEGLRPFLQLNPLYYYITAYQNFLIYGKMPSWDILLVIVLISVGFFIVGFWFFSKIKQLFDDNI